MIGRVLLIVPAGFLVWWFAYNVPDWIFWIQTSQSWVGWKALWALISYGGIIAVLACIGLLGRRSPFVLAVVGLVAFGFTSTVYAGYQASVSTEMDHYLAFSLFVGMVSSVPMVFSDWLAGKQVDIVGDGQ